MKIDKYFPIGTAVIFAVFLLLMGLTYFLFRSPAFQAPQWPAELQAVMRDQFKPIRTFHLVDQNNAAFDETNLKHRWSFVFFGYTSCPDICPNTLSVLSATRQLLKEETRQNTQFVFVSVDPERDTQEVLKSYMNYFNKRFTGATADKPEIDKLTRQFGASYKRDAPTESGPYTISHTSAVFLVDPYKRHIATFSQPHYAATIASLYEKIRAYAERRTEQ